MADYESGYDPKYGYNRNAFAHKTLVTAILGRTVKLIAAPIGLVSEALHHQKNEDQAASPVESLSHQSAPTAPTQHRDATRSHDDVNEPSSPVLVHVPADQAEELITKKQAIPADGQPPTHELVPLDSVEDDELDEDEADWALDDATVEIEGAEGDSTWKANTKIATAGSRSSAHKSEAKALPFPVILPQRRPGTKARGFVRAYAPVLQDAGIDQDMFLTFLKDFHKAAQASPIFDVIIIGTAIAGFYPDPVIGIAIQAVQVAAAIGQEAQERWRLNKFLDQANKELFIPKGLYALIVTYVSGGSDNGDVGSQTIDIGASAFIKCGSSAARSEQSAGSPVEDDKSDKMEEIREKMKRLRVASGQTTGEAQLPATCAPLIFPTLDLTAKERGGEGIGNDLKIKSKATSKFVQNYFDRRAQATYAYSNPDSTLTSSMGKASPQFKSRFADPNNATNTHFFTLITGGKFKAEPLGARRRYEKAQRKAEERRLQGLKERSAKRILQEGILYLTIVNMPTYEELEKARKEIEEKKNGRKAL